MINDGNNEFISLNTCDSQYLKKKKITKKKNRRNNKKNIATPKTWLAYDMRATELSTAHNSTNFDYGLPSNINSLKHYEGKEDNSTYTCRLFSHFLYN